MFFTRKPSLRNLIPADYADIHSHVLPGIDDGSKDVENSIKLLRALQNLGFSQMTATPHIIHGVWDNTPHTIFEAHQNLQDHLPSDLKNMVNGFAAEYMVTYDFNKKIDTNSLLTLDGKHVLIEFSFMEAPKIIFDVISNLKANNYEIILAHPERYAYYHDHFYLYEELKSYDVFFQLNLLSTVGYYGSKIAQMAETLLAQGLIDFTGSDVHHSGHIEAFDKKVKIKSINQLKDAMDNNKKLFQKVPLHSQKSYVAK